MEPLTKKQRKVLSFIERRLAENNPPSQREISAHFGLAQNAVYQLVRYLTNKGYLVNIGSHRGLRLSDAYLAVSKQRRGTPLVGQVAAGEPIFAEQNIEAYIDLGELLGNNTGDIFLLKIRGDSMIDEGIMDGDYVTVKSQSTIENGQIGVVLLDDEVTVKRVFLQVSRIALKPANKRAGYKTRYFRHGDKTVRILGKVIGCFRNIN